MNILAFVNVPKDLSRIKNKALFNLTVRQLLCFGTAAAIGIPAYIFLREPIGGTPAAFLMIGLMLPFFFFAMYEKDGQPAEKIICNMIRVRLLWPGKRPYKTENLYGIIHKEGKIIADQKKKPQAKK